MYYIALEIQMIVLHSWLRTVRILLSLAADVGKYGYQNFWQEKCYVIVRLPSTFGLVLDGWSINSDHYIGIFATFTDTVFYQTK